MSEPGRTAVPGVMTVPDGGLGNRAYLVDLGDGRALVVDPARDPSPYLAAAGRLGLSIAYSAETHLHADFLSGSRRQRSEYLVGHPVDATHVELGSLSQVAADLPRGPITTYCGHGERAMTAASILERAGHHGISVIEGGLDAWQRLGRPVETGD